MFMMFFLRAAIDAQERLAVLFCVSLCFSLFLWEKKTTWRRTFNNNFNTENNKSTVAKYSKCEFV